MAPVFHYGYRCDSLVVEICNLNTMAQADIEKRIELLEIAIAEYKTKKEMVDDSLTNDEELAGYDEKRRDAKKRYNAAKEALLGEPENRKLMEQMKDIAQDIKDTKKLLADELLTYFMKNNTLEYVDGKGKTRRISVSAKFVSAKGEDAERV